MGDMDKAREIVADFVLHLPDDYRGYIGDHYTGWLTDAIAAALAAERASLIAIIQDRSGSSP